MSSRTRRPQMRSIEDAPKGDLMTGFIPGESPGPSHHYKFWVPALDPASSIN